MNARLSDCASLSILFEDAHCFALNKSAGIHSVSLPHDEKDTLAARLLVALPELASAAEKPSDGGLVQRLDFETSGVLLGAKSRVAWTALHAQLAAGEIEKSYVALVEGKLIRDTAVNNYLGNSNRRAKSVKVFNEKPRDKDRALPARSRFVVLHYFPNLEASLVRVFAPTARRHQVRAHAASLGHPLVGDALYGSTRSVSSLTAPIGLPNGCVASTFLLHAEKLEFLHPITKESVTVEAPPPQMFEALYRSGKISAGAARSSTS